MRDIADTPAADGGRLANQPRRKGRDRTRVSRACDRCKGRKTRCSGTWPCTFCSRGKLDCRFTAVYRRGHVPTIDLNPDVAGDGGEYRPSVSPSSSSSSSRARIETEASPVSAAASPEPAGTDPSGHYVGPASGVSFLLRVQRTLQRQGPRSSSAFTFGDLPLPGDRAPFAILPPRAHAQAMVRRYFGFAAATNHFLHRPTIEAWLEELYDAGGACGGVPGRVAMLFMVFAFAVNYGHADDGVALSTSEAAELSARFYSVAEHQLSTDKGETSLVTVQAMLAQCFYLLAQSRLNHCWAVFGTAAHLMLALGIHRRAPATHQPVDYIEAECRKRTFWCAYTLNTYLSDILGRPMTFHDDDIDQELPLDVDDVQLQTRQVIRPNVVGPSTITGSIAHHRISRIQTRILRSLYGISTPSTEQHFDLAAAFTSELDKWRSEIQYLFDTDGHSSIYVGLVLRQRDVLRLTFWHSMVLVHRPFLLKTFASLAGESHVSQTRQPELEKNVQRCLDAAVHIVQQIDRISAAGDLYSTLFSIPYYGFSAVVVLYVYAIRQRAEPPDTYTGYFHDASQCHAQLERIASSGSMMARYGIVLQELRLEVLRHNAYLASSVTPRAGHDAGLDADKAGFDGVGERVSVEGCGSPTLVDEMGLFPVGFDAGTAEMAGWGQFDTLISGSIGRLDAPFFEGAAGGELLDGGLGW